MKKFGQVKVRLIELAQGPIHNDFKIKSQTAAGRILFDIKMTQQIPITIKTREVICHMNEKLNAKEYYYNLNILDYDNRQETELSKEFVNKFLNQQVFDNNSDKSISQQNSIDKTYNSQKSISIFSKQEQRKRSYENNKIIFPIKQSQLVAPKQEFQTSDLCQKYNYLKKESKNNMQEILKDNTIRRKLKWVSPLQIQYFVQISKLRHINLLITIWKTFNEQKNNKKYFVAGECYIQLQTLFTDQENLKKENQHQEYKANLFLNGKKVGEIKIQYDLQHKEFYQQKLAGVNTEDGIKHSAPIVKRRGSKYHEQLNDLNQYFDELNEKMIFRQTEDFPRKQIDNNISLSLKKINQLLKFKKQGFNTFLYKDDSELLKAQTLFLEIGFLILDSYEKFDENIGKDQFLCIKSILYRGEFQIESLGFTQKSISMKIKDKKIQIGLKYQKFLYKILNLVFLEFQTKGLLEYQKQFIEFYFAYAYFRIPEVRNQLLEYYNFKDNLQGSFEKGLLNDILLDWNQQLFNHLKKQNQEFKINQELLNQAIQKPWLEKFKNSNHFFFNFIIEWCEYVEINLTVHKIQWESIYGYDLLIDIYLSKINQKEITQITDQQIKAGIFLLKNPQNLNKFVYTIITATKYFNKFIQSEKCFTLFRCFIKMILPSNLDAHLIIQMTQVMFNTYHALGIAHALNFWYEFFTIFPCEIACYFSKIVIKFYFFNLFLHWSKNVRDVFYHIIIYRILPYNMNEDTDARASILKLIPIINQGLTIIENLGLQYRVYLAQKTKQSIKERRKTRKKCFKEIIKKEIEKQKNVYKDFLKVDMKETLTMVKLSKMKSINPVFIEENDQGMLNLEKRPSQNNGKRMVRSYQNLDTIKKSQIKPFQLVYCYTCLKQFLEILKNFKLENQSKKNMIVVPKLNFSLPIDRTDYQNDDEECVFPKHSMKLGKGKSAIFFKDLIINQFSIFV